MDHFAFPPVFDDFTEKRSSLPDHQPGSDILTSKCLQCASGTLLLTMLVDLHHIFLLAFSFPDLHLPPSQPVLKRRSAWDTKE